MKIIASLVTSGLFVAISGIFVPPPQIEPDFVTIPCDDEETETFTYEDTPIACDCYNIEMTLKEELEDRTCYSYSITKDRTINDCKPLRLRNFIMGKDCAVEDDDILAFTPIDMTIIAEPKRKPIEGIRVNVLEAPTDLGTEFYRNEFGSGESAEDIDFRVCYKPWMVNGEQESSQFALNMKGNPTLSATCDVGAIFPSFCRTDIKVLAAENVCMDSTQYSEEWAFNAPIDGDINGVELVYKSGSVSCNDGATDAESYWGCYRNLFLLNFMKMEESGNTVLYPTTTMEDFDEDGEYGTTASCTPGDCTVHKWTMETQTPYDDTLTLSDPSSPYTVTTDDSFSIQYSEGCCTLYESDNVGTVCADIYFYYDSIACPDDEDVEEPPTDEPTVRPTTSDPTADPTAKPTTSDPTSDPTAKPTTSDPTSDPTAKPTTSDPTSDPTAKPTTSAPTSDPTTVPTAKPTTADPTSEPTLKPSLAPTYTVCTSNDALNIAFLLDESGSIDYDEWEVVKTFVNRLITFDISSESYVSLFEYATQEAYENFQNWTKNDDVGKVVLTDAMTSNRWNSAGQTYTWWGTSKVLDAFWNYKNSCRDDSCTRKDMLFIITDGTPSDDVCPNIEARMAANDVDVIVIIIGGIDDPDTIEQQIGCLDKDGTDIIKVDGVDSDEFNLIEILIRAKTCSGSFPAGPETEPGVQYEYCPPLDPVNTCTYDLGIGSNVGTGGAGGALDAGQSAHADHAEMDSAQSFNRVDGKLAADYSRYDGVVVLTWSQLFSIALIVCAVTILALSICSCLSKMPQRGKSDFNAVKTDCDSDSEEEEDENSVI